MNQALAADSDFVLLGKGEALESPAKHFSAAVRAAVRYADPLAWLAATAVEFSLANAGAADIERRHGIGLITISDQSPGETIAAIAEAAAAGFSSPLRYPAANPGSLAGVTAISQGFRGPTMNLTMPVELGVPVAWRLGQSWLRRHHLAAAALVACGGVGPRKYFARCLLVASWGSGLPEMGAVAVEHLEWLAQTPALISQGAA